MAAAVKGLDLTQTPTYNTVHHRLRDRRGSATAHTCVDCGNPAEQWSYDHQDPDEVIGTNGDYLLHYSTKMEHYEPRCCTCHKRFDVGRDTNEVHEAAQ